MENLVHIMDDYADTITVKQTLLDCLKHCIQNKDNMEFKWALHDRFMVFLGQVPWHDVLTTDLDGVPLHYLKTIQTLYYTILKDLNLDDPDIVSKCHPSFFFTAEDVVLNWHEDIGCQCALSLRLNNESTSQLSFKTGDVVETIDDYKFALINVSHTHMLDNTGSPSRYMLRIIFPEHSYEYIKSRIQISR